MGMDLCADDFLTKSLVVEGLLASVHRRLRTEGIAVAIMIWRTTTLRGRLTLWYTGMLTSMFAVLGATSVILLDRGLQMNVDDSLNSVASAIADSVRRPSFFGPDIE